MKHLFLGFRPAEARYELGISHAISSLDSCMQRVREYLEKNPSEPVNFPLIGSHLGGLHWPVVREIIEHRIPDTFTKNLYILP